MDLQGYLQAFERKVDLSVERTFGEVPYYKKGKKVKYCLLLPQIYTSTASAD